MAVVITDASPNFSQCEFSVYPSGAVAISGNAAALTFWRCAFDANTSGAVQILGGSAPYFSACTFIVNSSANSAGAITCDGSSSTLVFCNFIGNTAQNPGGGQTEGGALYADSNSNITSGT